MYILVFRANFFHFLPIIPNSVVTVLRVTPSSVAISAWVRPSFFNRFASSSFRAFGLMPLHHFRIVGMLYPSLLAMSGCFIPCFRISRACCLALAFGSMPLHHRETVEMFTWMLLAMSSIECPSRRNSCACAIAAALGSGKATL